MRRSALVRTISVVISGIVIASSVAACSFVKIKKFEVSPEDIELNVGETIPIEVDLRTDPRDSDIEIEYSSSDDSVAEVDNEGIITGISEGECEISISAGDEEKTVDVTVYEIYNWGDTVTINEMFEFTPQFECFADEVNNFPESDDYLSPQGGHSAAGAFGTDSEHVIMYFTGVVELVGSPSRNETFYMHFSVNYGDYVFDQPLQLAYAYDLNNPNWVSLNFSGRGENSTVSTVFEPLVHTKRYVRFIIQVPQQVEDDTETPCYVTFSFDGEEYTYSLR